MQADVWEGRGENGEGEGRKEPRGLVGCGGWNVWGNGERGEGVQGRWVGGSDCPSPNSNVNQNVEFDLVEAG